MKRRKITWASVFIMLCMLASSSFLLSSYQAKQMTDDVWKLLGLSKQSGTESIKNSFLNGYLYYYGVKNAKNLAVNDRAAIAKDLLSFTKEYVSSIEFKKQYEQLRENAKPHEPQIKPLRSITAIQQEEIAKTEKGIKDTEKTMKELKPEMAKNIQPVLDMLRKNLKEYQDPGHQYFASIAMGEKYQQENEAKRFKEDVQKWETEYPENINRFVAGKLEKMLECTKGIDYTAVLVEKHGKKRFANPAYEGKRTEWKQGFRAGKEVTEQARVFAADWLQALQ